MCVMHPALLTQRHGNLDLAAVAAASERCHCGDGKNAGMGAQGFHTSLSFSKKITHGFAALYSGFF